MPLITFADHVRVPTILMATGMVVAMIMIAAWQTDPVPMTSYAIFGATCTIMVVSATFGADRMFAITTPLAIPLILSTHVAWMNGFGWPHMHLAAISACLLAACSVYYMFMKPWSVDDASGRIGSYLYADAYLLVPAALAAYGYAGGAYILLPPIALVLFFCSAYLFVFTRKGFAAGARTA